MSELSSQTERFFLKGFMKNEKFKFKDRFIKDKPELEDERLPILKLIGQVYLLRLSLIWQSKIKYDNLNVIKNHWTQLSEINFLFNRKQEKNTDCSKGSWNSSKASCSAFNID